MAAAVKDAEAKDYIKRAQQENDQEAYVWLYEKYRRFIFRQACRFSADHSTLLSVDELYGAGSLGFTKGIKTFDVSRDVNVLTYLAWCIDNEMRGTLRRHKKDAQVSSIEVPVAQKEGKAVTVSDTLLAAEKADATQLIHNDDMLTGLALIYAYKNGNYAELLRRSILYEETQAEVAAAIGTFSQSYVSRIVASFKRWAQLYTREIESGEPSRMTQHIHSKVLALKEELMVNNGNRKGRNPRRTYAQIEADSQVAATAEVEVEETAPPEEPKKDQPEEPKKAPPEPKKAPPIEPEAAPPSSIHFELTLVDDAMSTDNVKKELDRLHLLMSMFAGDQFAVTLKIRKIGQSKPIE